MVSRPAEAVRVPADEGLPEDLAREAHTREVLANQEPRRAAVVTSVAHRRADQQRIVVEVEAVHALDGRRLPRERDLLDEQHIDERESTSPCCSHAADLCALTR
jgi:hypothetical protein